MIRSPHRSLAIAAGTASALGVALAIAGCDLGNTSAALGMGPPFDVGHGPPDVGPPRPDVGPRRRDAGMPDAPPDAPDAPCVCPPPDSCHLPTTCSDGGGCFYSTLPDGTACGTAGICSTGVCVEPPPGCGDGVRAVGPAPPREGCDDGNLIDGDACSRFCQPTPFVVAPRAGEAGDGELDFPPGPSIGVATDGTGAALYVWTAALTTGRGSEVRARRYRRNGEFDGAVIAIATSLGVGVDPHPTVAGLSGGGWVVAWEDPAIDMSSLGIAYRTVRPDGTLGTVRRANERRLLRQHEPAMASLGDSVVITWTDESGLIDGASASRIAFRILGPTGLAVGGEVAVAISPSDELGEPSIGTNSDGEIVVAWTDRGADPGFLRTVWARRYFDRSPLDPAPFQLVTTEAHSPSVAALDSGFFAVAWTSRAVDGGGDIVARLITSTTAPLGGSLITVASGVDMMTPPMPIAETEPSVAHLAATDFLTTWSAGRDRTGVGVTASDTILAPPEVADLAAILAESTVGDVSVSGGPTGVWVSYSIAERAPVSGAIRAVYGYLLPAD